MSPLAATDLHQIFQDLDQNGDGFLSVDELNLLLERTGVHLSPNEVESSLGKSSLNFDEFLVFVNSILSSQNEHEEGISNSKDKASDDLLEAFNVFDLDGDGFITCKELQVALERLGIWDEKNRKDPKTMICKYDTNFDGVVDFEEFKKMMLHNA